MIKFFRKIRQGLLTENKFSKYLIYAIGEIVLVVIGILIALQINNWNEQHKTHAKQEAYLQLIKGEMSNNLESLRTEKVKLSTSIDSQKQILELMHDQTALATISEEDLSLMMLPALSFQIAVNIEQGVLSELISSGGLKEIENDSISTMLSSWDGRLYKLRQHEESLGSLFTKNNDYFGEHGAFRTIFDNTSYTDYVEINSLPESASNKHILSSQTYENILLIQLATSTHLSKSVYPRFENEILDLIGLIDHELNDID